MKTRFIIVRHGFSVANDQKRFAGHSDFPLTELGLLQAEKCAAALKDEMIDVIYASDLSRAYATAVPTAKAHSLGIIPHKGLREIFAGEWEGSLFTELCEKYADSYSVWKNDIGRASCDGGESVGELYDRVVSTVLSIAEAEQGKVVFIATHATPIRALCAAAAGRGASGMSEISWVSNASVNVFEVEDGRITAIATDRTDHLDDLRTNLPSNV